jgi:transposase
VSILADRVDVVVGVDAHADTLTATLVTAVGVFVDELTVPADGRALSLLGAWADRHAAGQRRVWVIDGSRSYGVGLLRQLRATGEAVAEAPRIGRGARRGTGKSDSIDAALIARAALAAGTVAEPRADGIREALRILLVTRRHHSDTRTATVNLLKSLIVTADEDLRQQLRGRSTAVQLGYLLDLDDQPTSNQLTRIIRQQLVDLARRTAELDRILKANKAEINALVGQSCPALLDEPGVGPITAATALCAWSHRGRVRNEAAFAALAGTNPIPASSGKTVRHRLNRGGDRTLNRALHTIATVRRRVHQPTRDYVARRTHEGKTDPEINRCLKRYLSRRLFRIMQANATLA